MKYISILFSSSRLREGSSVSVVPEGLQLRNTYLPSCSTLAMVAQSNVVPAVNGSLEHISKNKINAKSIKSKTQLRRLKQKQKKQAVRSPFFFHHTVDSLITHTSRWTAHGMGYKGVWAMRVGSKISLEKLWKNQEKILC